MTDFLGRSYELEKLLGLLNKKVASLVVLKGRRRIGKSRLAKEFAAKFKHAYSFTGLPPTEETSAQMERDYFASTLANYMDTPIEDTRNWETLLLKLAAFTKKGRTLIILDEINWLAKQDPTFLGKLKNIWDEHFKDNPKLVMILSGSMSAWIERNILSHTGFLGRTSLELTLEELPLNVCTLFWRNYRTQLSDHEIFKLLSVTGGVPRYLEEVDPTKSAQKNILDLAFLPDGILYNEFDRIFSDLFSSRSATYKKIILALVQGSKNLEEVCKALSLQKSGVVSSYLDDLIETGYVAKDITWNIRQKKQSNLCVYRLCDNYIRFYLRYVLPKKTQIKKKRISAVPGWNSIMGLQFENLVINNFHLLDELLKIKKEEIIFDGPYFQKANKTQQGCQVDYLIQTKFNTLYICEVRFWQTAVDTDIIKEMKQKIAALGLPRHISYRPVLIHVNGVTDAVIEAEYFANIINFSDFLHFYPA